MLLFSFLTNLFAVHSSTSFWLVTAFSHLLDDDEVLIASKRVNDKRRLRY
jgi:hypothetical protein